MTGVRTGGDVGAVEAVPFDLQGPLPTGVSVLEASAGTGKTYTIAGLAARYVAAGVPIDRLLVVTFTRMATGELRERVRERLTAVRRGLDQALAVGAPPPGDPVIDLLSAGTDHELGARRTRLARALADFDAATIATTHQFCQEVLVGLGIAADLEPDFTFEEDLRDLSHEVVADLYVRAFHSSEAPEIPFDQAAEIVRCAIDNPAATIAAAGDGTPARRRRLAIAAREELERRKRRMAVMTYDDLLTRLCDALRGDAGGDIAGRLRARYDVVLVDEFQDTDPVQWEIMRTAFGSDGGTLVLIADPKQAIYAFRGADVFSYLEAARAARAPATLQVNWRSDQGLIDAYDALFAGAQLGHAGIVYRRVRATPANRSSRLTDGRSDSPLRIRVLPRETIARTPAGFARNRAARERIAGDLAADVVALLSSPAEIERRDELGRPLDRAPVCPADLAVLVATNRNAALIRDALDAASVPAVINGAGSVFGTQAALEWLRLLEALERPAATGRAHSAALTGFLGFSPERVATADEAEWAEVHRRLHNWARILRVRGVASLMEAITLGEGLPRRVLSTVDGERQLTDLRHIGQLLHRAFSNEQIGATALASWLRRRILEAGGDTGDEERSRRLESDADAVQVLTIHRSKGLEFPIVYLPFLWEPSYIPSGAKPVFFHDPDAGDERTIDVGLEGPEWAAHRDQHVLEQRGEDLRLAYVALTRARHQAVVWWAGSWDTRHSPLTRLLFSRDERGAVASGGRFTPDDGAAMARFEQLATVAPGRISVERALPPGLPATWRGPPPPAGRLSVTPFERDLDRRWRRTSYTDITAAAYEARVDSEPEQRLIADEPESASPEPAAPPAQQGDVSPVALDAMGAGTKVGTVVHRLLQELDFAAPNLDRELARGLAVVGAVEELGDPAVVLPGLRDAIATPLGPLVSGIALRDVVLRDRVDELEFELPLAGGDQPTGWVTTERIATTLEAHLPAGDPLSGYAERLRDPALRPRVRGYLTGSLDLVVRLPGNRFAIVDYKTNRLAGHDEPLTSGHHRPAALAAEMRRHHYGLQALLYTVALHRYLRWRLPEYHPERHLAGVLYLFLRGMTGPETPTQDGHPFGVFAWRPPAALVTALSDLLSAGGAA
jgi:exodeoxyribonuclease V beta subunit